MNLFSRIFRRNELKEVFTPGVIAKKTYVKRATLEADVDKFIDLPGLQIVLFGASGCGKSTLIFKKLEEHKIKWVKTSCSSDTTFDSLLKSAFDQLNAFVLTEISNSHKNIKAATLSAKLHRFEVGIKNENTNETSSTSSRIIPIQITAQRLAEFLGEAECVWVIEDFHKVAMAEKTKIADVMKVFVNTADVFPKVKIICLGVVGSAQELLQLDPNLQTRVAEIHVPLLTNAQLGEIVNRGFGLMNVKFKDGIRDRIVYYANNLGSICHHICNDICFNRGITKSRFFPVNLDHDDFNKSVESYVRRNSDTFTRRSEKIFSEKARRAVLQAFINSEQQFLSYGDLRDEAAEIGLKDPLEFQTVLESLISINFDEVLRFDENSKRYSFSNPFFYAFIKMKLAIETLEKGEIARRKKQKGLPLISSQAVFSFRVDDLFVNKVSKELNGYFESYLSELAAKSIEIPTNVQTKNWEAPLQRKGKKK